MGIVAALQSGCVGEGWAGGLIFEQALGKKFSWGLNGKTIFNLQPVFAYVPMPE